MWLAGVARPGAAAFALLFTLESIARATLATVIPLQAYATLESSRAVSLLFTCVGGAGLTGSLLVPLLIRRVPRRFVYTLGTLGLIAAAGLFALDGPAGLLAGLIVRVLGVGCLGIVLNLYIMDTIPRGELVRSEPLRLAVSGAAWTLCPLLGVLLYGRYGAIAADGLSAAAALVLLATFWVLRLSDHPAIVPGRRPPPNPLRNIGRFLAQPRLRLGWLIAFGRSSWWSQFFTFAPLYMVIAGHSELASAVLISLGNATLVLTVLIGRLAERVGVRRVIVDGLPALGDHDAARRPARADRRLAPGRGPLAAGIGLGKRARCRWQHPVPARRAGPRTAPDDRRVPDLHRPLGPAAVRGFRAPAELLRPRERVRDRRSLDARDRSRRPPPAAGDVARSAGHPLAGAQGHGQRVGQRGERADPAIRVGAGGARAEADSGGLR